MLLGLVLVLGSLLPVTDVLKKNGILVLPLREKNEKQKALWRTRGRMEKDVMVGYGRGKYATNLV